MPTLTNMKTALTAVKTARNKAARVAKNTTAKTAQTKVTNKNKANLFSGLSKELLLQMYELMVKSRVLEERLIKIYRAGESFFWIGGPGEEAWGVPLGLLTRKGQGVEYDFLHLHYRCTPTMVALGMPMIDATRLMMNRATDVSTGGRNFSGHYCFPKWNVAPVTSPIEVQYPIACGTAHAQKRAKTKSISIVSGGDAGTAEGDFASCLVWSSRRGQELPMLITTQNNKWGISTAFQGQHGEETIANRAKGFEIRARVINGNDPVESYLAIREEMEYIRRTGKPSFIEATVSRLYGHSSASGANPEKGEFDCVREFETKLLKAGMLTDSRAKEIWRQYEAEGVAAADQARTEPAPQAASIWDQVYVNNENADWRKF